MAMDIPSVLTSFIPAVVSAALGIPTAQGRIGGLWPPSCPSLLVSFTSACPSPCLCLLPSQVENALQWDDGMVFGEEALSKLFRLCVLVRKDIREAREVAQRLSALTVLGEDLDSIPSTDMAVHNCHYLQVKGYLMPSSDLTRHQGCMWSTHIHAGQTHTFKKERQDTRDLSAFCIPMHAH